MKLLSLALIVALLPTLAMAQVPDYRKIYDSHQSEFNKAFSLATQVHLPKLPKAQKIDKSDCEKVLGQISWEYVEPNKGYLTGFIKCGSHKLHLANEPGSALAGASYDLIIYDDFLGMDERAVYIN